MGVDFRPGHRAPECPDRLRRGEWLPWSGLPSAGLSAARAAGGAARLGDHPAVHGSLDSIYLSLFGGEGQGCKQKPNRNKKLSHGPQAPAADTGAAPGPPAGEVPSAA